MTPLAAPTPSPAPRGSRRTVLVVLGVVVLAAGSIGSAVLWFSAATREDDAIRGLARAPVGCDTTLDFAERGTYLIFAENKGSIDDVDGDCGVSGDFSGSDETPALRVQLFDAAGDSIDLPRRTGVTYDGAGSQGTSIRSVEISEAGSYVVRAESSDDAVAIAVGPDPSDGVALLRNLAVLSAILGLVGGGILLVLGSRRSKMIAAPSGPTWPTSSAVPSPPGMAAPGLTSPSGWRPASGPPTTLRPPTPVPPSSGHFPAPLQPTPSPPGQAGGVSQSWPAAPEPEAPTTWAPQPPTQPIDSDDSSWAPPSE